MKNLDEVVEIKFVNFNYSGSVRDYILRKLIKHESESNLIHSIKVRVSSLSNNKYKTYQISFEVDLKNSGFIVKKTGADIYGLIDEASDAFRKKLVKLIDAHSEHHKNPNKNEDLLSEIIFKQTIKYPTSNYEDINLNKYLILEEKSFNDHTPLHLEEAIDLMEIIGRNCLLFKNINTGKYSVVYKVHDGIKEGYGVINSKM